MPKFRVYRYYVDPSRPPTSRWTQDRVHETAWQEEVNAANAEQALDAFFDGHAGPGEVQRLDHETGKGAQMYASDRYEPDETYLWIEDGKLMEYEGIEPVIFGRTICPLCEGKGGIDQALADYYFESEEQS